MTQTISRPASGAAAQRHGFTLVELLVAMAVGTIVIGCALASLNALSNQWLVNSALVRSRAEARLTMDCLRRDLESALRAAPGDWLLLRPSTLATGGAPASNELYLLATSQDHTTNQLGDVWALGYALALADPLNSGGPDPRRALYRLRLNPPDVFANGIESTDWWNLFWLPRRSGLDAPPNLLAQNAVFRCEAIVEDRATKISHRVPLDRNVRINATGVVIDPPLAALQSSALRLTAINLSLVILRPEGLTLLRERQVLTDDQWRRFGDTFSERINF